MVGEMPRSSHPVRNAGSRVSSPGPPEESVHRQPRGLWRAADRVGHGRSACRTAGTCLCLICAEELRWRWYGIALALGGWIVWVAAYDVAEGFRNVNQ